MSTQNPKITTVGQLAILKALVRGGELPAVTINARVQIAILKKLLEPSELSTSKTENPTGTHTDKIMKQLAGNGWVFSCEEVPALKTDGPSCTKLVYRLDRAHRELAAKMIDQIEEQGQS